MPHQSATSALTADSGRSAEAFADRLCSDEQLSERAAHIRTEDARPADLVPVPPEWPAVARDLLERAGRASLFRHQQEAIDHALAGRNVVIATDTSSGKSLCFQVPTLAAIAAESQSRALFVFPTNPLANDQESSLRELVKHLPPESAPRWARLQGGMGSRKDRIAEEDPQIILTNPEMVHLTLLPSHAKWERFWRGLKYIVVDEIHLYRGAFGGHLANLIRRVRRCAWRYGAKPTVIAASATAGNPKALAEELCAAPFELIDKSAAPRSRRTTVLWRPPDEKNGRSRSHSDESVFLFERALAANLQCILFVRSRQLVELLVRKLEESTRRSRVQLGVRAYRAGYLREEREVIEQGLRSGTVRGVVTTNALELGIDIGALDVCIISGYPGSAMALRQQAGRVGRRDRSAAVFVVAGANPLDTYLLHHPELLFEAPPEKAVVGRLNPHILRAHLASAASEFPLWETEIERFGGDVARTVTADLVDRGEARWSTPTDGKKVLLANGRPHGQVSLRSASQERWKLIGPEGDTVGELSGESLAREAFPGSIYLHQGRAFRVQSHDDGRVILARASPKLSTRVQGERSVTIIEQLKARPLVSAAPDLAEVAFARVDVIDRYGSYIETGAFGRGQTLPIEPPMKSQLRTEALWFHLLPRGVAALRQEHPDIDAALHAAEHALGALCASIVLCDRDDIEGHVISTGGDVGIVVFDRFPGGMGIAAAAFDSADAMVQRAGETIDECGCDDGCPACVHMSRCLRGNDAIDKRGASFLLRLLRGMDVPVPKPVREVAPVHKSTVHHPKTAEAKKRPQRRYQIDRGTELEFAPGDRVEHSVYGSGRVIEVRPSGRVVVDFGDGKERRITRTWLQRGE